MARIALAGNPNAGKTSLFNRLTGAVQHVSNYPGVTVERKEGRMRLAKVEATVVDLPGTYSLSAYSQEEVVARNFLITDKPEVVVDVVDATNLERNLYLTVQLLEMNAPLVIALNMADMAEKRGVAIDAEKLSRLLGAPVIPTVASRGEGVEQLRVACEAVIEGRGAGHPIQITYGHEVNTLIDELSELIGRNEAIAARFPPRWVAVKLLEQDEDVLERIKELSDDILDIEHAVEQAIKSIESHYNEDALTIIAERRYGFAAGAMKECVTFSGESRQHLTDQIDALVCSRAFGPFFLLGVVATLFFVVFKFSDEWAWIPWPGGWLSPTGLMEQLFAQLSVAVSGLATAFPLLHSLLDDGIISGVGGVMSFVPLIFIMFLCISILEDTGYIARVAFLLDRILRTFGLQGKSVLAMIVAGGLGAGGCAVPAVMATRTLREERDRLVTMLVVPFMNCGAKMPVYAMLIAAFFQEKRTLMMLILWFVSWCAALSAALFLRKFVVRGEQTPFVLELPPYHLPTLRGAFRHTWERTWMYVKKAGTIILAINILLWATMYFPRPPAPVSMNDQTPAQRQTAELKYSLAGRLGAALEPTSKLAGFDWRTNIALIGGFAAKEVIIGTLGTAYSMGEVDAEEAASLSQRLGRDPSWSPLGALSLMLFVMLYAPCLATIAVIRRESGSWKWALFSTLYTTTFAFVVAVIVYQIGRALGWGI